MISRGFWHVLIKFISWVSEISACWTSRAWCCPCQTSGDFFAFYLIFGLILRFLHTSDSNFFLVHDARKADFAPYMCLAYRCPGRRRTTVGKEIRLLFLESPQFFKTAKERTKWINWFPVSSTVLCTDPSRKFANCTFKRCCELEHLKFRSQSLN